MLSRLTFDTQNGTDYLYGFCIWKSGSDILFFKTLQIEPQLHKKTFALLTVAKNNKWFEKKITQLAPITFGWPVRCYFEFHALINLDKTKASSYFITVGEKKKRRKMSRAPAEISYFEAKQCYTEKRNRSSSKLIACAKQNESVIKAY